MFRWLLLGCAALAAVLGCGGAPRAHRPGDEWLESIRIDGNRTIEEDDLLPGLSLRRTEEAGRALDPYQLSLDTQRIRAAYLRLGFFEVRVTARIDRRGGAQLVVFSIVEGKRSTTQVEILGLPADLPFAQARALIELDDGAPFDYDLYDAAKDPLLLWLQDAGYAHAQLDAAVLADRSRGVATARFAIDAGARATFGSITVTGTDGELAKAILGRLAFAQGDTYSATALADSLRAINDLGRFSAVRVEPDPTAGPVVPVKISVALANRHEVKLGGGLGYEPLTFELRGRIGGSYVSATHPLWTLAADLRPALTVHHDFTYQQPKVRALATAHRLDLFAPRVRGEVELGADYLTVEAYTSTGPRARLGLSAPLGALWLQGRVGWVLEYLVFSEPKVFDPTLQELRLDRSQRRGAYEQSIVADLRDDQLEPHRGVYVEVRASEGTQFAGGALTYLQLTPEFRGYVPLGKRLVLAARIRAGGIYGDVPVTERYFSGGATSQRGFSERRLSPTVPGSVDGGVGVVAIGGAGLLETSVELRVPLGEVELPVGTELFLDGADVTLAPGDLDPTHLHWAAGVGLWAKLGGFKLRLDVGYRLNRRGPNEPAFDTGTFSNFVAHFGVGDTY